MNSAVLSKPNVRFLDSRRGALCPVLLVPDPPTSRWVSSNSTSTSMKIVGGRPSRKNIARYLAFLDNGHGGTCSGTMVAPTVIITAAHCDIWKRSFAYIGLRSLHRGTGIGVKEFIPSSRFRLPEKFIFAAQYDFAFVILSKRAPRGTGYMSVNVNKSIPMKFSIARVAGYGLVQEDFESGENKKLLQVDLPIPNKADCQIAGGTGYNHSIHVCAGYSNASCGTCHGDSGGPLFAYDQDDNPVLLGVVSYSIGCARPGKQGVYSRTSPYLEMYSNYPEIKLVNQTKPENLGLPYPSGVLPLPGMGLDVIIGTVVIFIVVILAFVIFEMMRKRGSANKRKTQPNYEKLDLGVVNC